MADNAAVASTSLTCSSDGKIVYAADLYRIYKSEDYGANWTIIMDSE